MDERPESSRPLADLHRRRRTIHRWLVVAAVLGLLIVRGVGWLGRKLSPAGSAPSASSLAVEDYARYHQQTVTCVKVVDGDTVDVGVPDLKAGKPQAYTRLRLWGIDTPEIRHFDKPAMYYGYEAAEFARKLMAGKKVRLELVESETRDKFGRLLAYVFLSDGLLYNAVAVSEGYAYAEDRFPHPRKTDFLKLEAEARANRRGLWAGITPDQLPHWYKPARLREFWQSQNIPFKLPAPGSKPPSRRRAGKSRTPISSE